MPLNDQGIGSDGAALIPAFLLADSGVGQDSIGCQTNQFLTIYGEPSSGTFTLTVNVPSGGGSNTTPPLPFNIPPGEPPQNDVQTITLNATGGTYTLSQGTNVTPPIAWNASLGTVQVAVTNLPGIGYNNVIVTGVPGYQYVLTGAGSLADTFIPTFQANGNMLTLTTPDIEENSEVVTPGTINVVHTTWGAGSGLNLADQLQKMPLLAAVATVYASGTPGVSYDLTFATNVPTMSVAGTNVVGFPAIASISTASVTPPEPPSNVFTLSTNPINYPGSTTPDSSPVLGLPPIISSVTPAVANLSGGSWSAGTGLTIVGQYFTTTTAVYVGTDSVGFNVVNDSTLQSNYEAASSGQTVVRTINEFGVSNAYPLTYASNPGTLPQPPYPIPTVTGQTYAIQAIVNGNTFTSSQIACNATPEQVQEAILALGLNAMMSVLVEWDQPTPVSDQYTITMSATGGTFSIMPPSTAATSPASYSQTLTVNATGGTFSISLLGSPTVLPFDVDLATMQGNLQSIINLSGYTGSQFGGGGSVTVTGSPGTYYVITPAGTLTNEPIPFVLSTSGLIGNAVLTNSVATANGPTQTLTLSAVGGTFTITVNGQTTGPLQFSCDLVNFENALGLIIGPGNVSVTGVPGQYYLIQGAGSLSGQYLALSVNTSALNGTAFFTTPGGVADQQTITVEAVSGSFTVSVNGGTTPPLAFNLDLADFQNAIWALPGIGTENITVTGTPGLTYVLTGAGALNASFIPSFVLNTSLLGGIATIVRNSVGSNGTGGANGLPWNITGPDLELAIETIVGAGNCEVNATNNGYQIQGAGTLEFSPLPVFTLSPAGLTGGTATIAHTVTAVGLPQAGTPITYTITFQANIPLLGISSSFNQGVMVGGYDPVVVDYTPPLSDAGTGADIAIVTVNILLQDFGLGEEYMIASPGRVAYPDIPFTIGVQ